MFGKGKPEVLVVGAGPVGLFAALALAKRGVQVQIVDRAWRTGAHSYALALHRSSLKLLEKVGLLDKVLEGAYRIERVALYDNESRRGEICLSSEDPTSVSLAVLRQDAFERLLEEALNDLGVQVLWNHEVSRLVSEDDRVVATIDTLEKDTLGYAAAHTEWVVARSTELTVPFVIGADGHRSQVRRSLGIEFPQVGDVQHFAVFEFHTSADLRHAIAVVLGDGTTDVLWPMPEGYCRWGFELKDYAAAEDSRAKDRIAIQLGGAPFPLLEEQSLERLIGDRAPWFEGEIEEINWRIAVRFERRLASAFGKQRVWLAGDAAHMTGPVGMQSMNVGLREAYELAAGMAALLQGQDSPERLQEYDRRGMAEWRFLLGLEGGLEPQREADPWIGQHRARLLSCIPASGPDLAHLAQQLRLTASSVPAG